MYVQSPGVSGHVSRRVWLSVDVDTVCLFRVHLDKFWIYEDVTYDFTANLTGIGDRSVDEISGL